MAKTFSFISSREGPLYVYRYLNAADEKLVQRPFPEKIDQKWWDNWDFRPHKLYNVSGLSPVQNAVYLSLVWKLTHGMKRLGLPHWTRDDAADEIAKNFELVKWEYSSDLHGKIIDRGFTLASSCPGPINKRLYTDKWKFEHRHLAGLFALDSFEEFIGIQKPSLVDESSETNYFAFDDDKRMQEFIAALKSDIRPNLANLLDGKDIFIDVYVGLDFGYPDSILIKTKSDIGPQLDMLVKEYQASIEKFEVRMIDSYEMDDFTDAITELVNL